MDPGFHSNCLASAFKWLMDPLSNTVHFWDLSLIIFKMEGMMAISFLPQQYFMPIRELVLVKYFLKLSLKKKAKDAILFKIIIYYTYIFINIISKIIVTLLYLWQFFAISEYAHVSSTIVDSVFQAEWVSGTKALWSKLCFFHCSEALYSSTWEFCNYDNKFVFVTLFVWTDNCPNSFTPLPLSFLCHSISPALKSY